MKVITLCGSTRFKKEFEAEQARLTLEGNIVISVGLFGHQSGLDMNSDTKRMLDKMHFRKIDISDEIFVINPGGYIGLSTCDEIHYAEAQNKPIHFFFDPANKMNELKACHWNHVFFKGRGDNYCGNCGINLQEPTLAEKACYTTEKEEKYLGEILEEMTKGMMDKYPPHKFTPQYVCNFLTKNNYKIIKRG